MKKTMIAKDGSRKNLPNVLLHVLCNMLLLLFGTTTTTTTIFVNSFCLPTSQRVTIQNTLNHLFQNSVPNNNNDDNDNDDNNTRITSSLSSSSYCGYNSCLWKKKQEQEQHTAIAVVDDDTTTKNNNNINNDPHNNKKEKEIHGNNFMKSLFHHKSSFSNNNISVYPNNTKKKKDSTTTPTHHTILGVLRNNYYNKINVEDSMHHHHYEHDHPFDVVEKDSSAVPDTDDPKTILLFNEKKEDTGIMIASTTTTTTTMSLKTMEDDVTTPRPTIRHSTRIQDLLDRVRSGQLTQEEKEGFFLSALTSGNTVRGRKPAIITDNSDDDDSISSSSIGISSSRTSKSSSCITDANANHNNNNRSSQQQQQQQQGLVRRVGGTFGGSIGLVSSNNANANRILSLVQEKQTKDKTNDRHNDNDDDNTDNRTIISTNNAYNRVLSILKNDSKKVIVHGRRTTTNNNNRSSSSSTSSPEDDKNNNSLLLSKKKNMDLGQRLGAAAFAEQQQKKQQQQQQQRSVSKRADDKPTTITQLQMVQHENHQPRKPLLLLHPKEKQPQQQLDRLDKDTFKKDMDLGQRLGASAFVEQQRKRQQSRPPVVHEGAADNNSIELRTKREQQNLLQKERQFDQLLSYKMMHGFHHPNHDDSANDARPSKYYVDPSGSIQKEITNIGTEIKLCPVDQPKVVNPDEEFLKKGTNRSSIKKEKRIQKKNTVRPVVSLDGKLSFVEEVEEEIVVDDDIISPLEVLTNSQLSSASTRLNIDASTTPRRPTSKNGYSRSFGTMFSNKNASGKSMTTDNNIIMTKGASISHAVDRERTITRMQATDATEFDANGNVLSKKPIIRMKIPLVDYTDYVEDGIGKKDIHLSIKEAVEKVVTSSSDPTERSKQWGIDMSKYSKSNQ